MKKLRDVFVTVKQAQRRQSLLCKPSERQTETAAHVRVLLSRARNL